METGDYIRTKNGIIGKIESKNLIGYNDWIIDTLYYNDDEIIDDWTCGVKEYDILKSSPNIIDLIEEGDIVKIEYQGWHQVSIKFETLKFFDDEGTEYLYDEIRAIITREQLESMKYKVGE